MSEHMSLETYNKGANILIAGDLMTHFYFVVEFNLFSAISAFLRRLDLELIKNLSISRLEMSRSALLLFVLFPKIKSCSIRRWWIS